MMDPVARLSSLSPTIRRLIRAYGLIALIGLAFLLMALLVHEAPKTVPQGLGVAG